MAASGLGQLALAVVVVVAARAHDPSELGHVLAALSLGLAVSGLLDFGILGHATRELALRQIDAPEASRRLSAKQIYTVAILIPVAAAFGMFVTGQTALLTAGVTLASSASQIAQVPLRAFGYAERAAAALMVDRLVVLGAFLGLESLTVPLSPGLLGAYILGSLFDVFTAHAMTPRALRLKLVLFFGNPWRGAGSYGVFGLATSAQALDLPLLSAVADTASAGLYGAVNRWTSAVGMLSHAFASSAVPYFATASGAKDAWSAIRRSAWLLWTVMCVCFIVAIFSETITKLLLGDAFIGAHEVLRVLAIASAVAVVNQPLAAYLMTRGQDGPVAKISIALTGAQLLSVATLAPHGGAIVAAGAVLAVQILSLVAYVWLARQRRRMAAPNADDVTDLQWG